MKESRLENKHLILPSFLQTQIGYLETDTVEEKFKKSALVLICILTGICGLIWGGIYFLMYGMGIISFLPWLYSLLMAFRVWIFSYTKNYHSLATSFLFIILIIPSLLQLVLGGLVQSSTVVYWCILAPIGALMFQRKKANYWFLSFAVFVFGSVFADRESIRDHWTGELFIGKLLFGLNILGPTLSIFITMRFFVDAFFKEHFLVMEESQELKEANLEMNQKEEILTRETFDLKMANQTKNLLFSILSHDLKGPFNNLKVMFGMIDEGYLEVQEMRKYFPRIRNQVENVSLFLENILQWVQSQMEGYEMQIKPEKIQINSIILEIIELFKETSNAKNVPIVFSPDHNYEALVDPNHFRLVMRNLINNALKFSNPGESIEITTGVEKNYIAISVVDKGIGIPKENLDTLFDGPNSSTEGTMGEHGTGLGLVLSKEMMEKNKGKIRVQNNLEKGSTFTLLLPHMV